MRAVIKTIAGGVSKNVVTGETDRFVRYLYRRIVDKMRTNVFFGGFCCMLHWFVLMV